MTQQLHPLPALLATLVLAACSTAPNMPDKAWKIAPVQTVRHGDGVRADGYFALGRVREGQGAHAKAMEAYRKAIDADPGYAAAWNALGVLQVQQGASEEGIRSIEQAVRLSPATSHFYNNLGYALMLGKRHDTAAVALQRAVELDPANRRAWRNLASLWEGQGNAKQAAIAEANASGAAIPTRTARAAAAEPERLAAPQAAPVIAVVTPVAPPFAPREVQPIELSRVGAETQPPSSSQGRSAIPAEQAPTAAAPSVQTAPEAVLIKVADNVFELRNAPVTRVEAIAEAAEIIRAAAPVRNAATPKPPEGVKAAAVLPQVRVARYEITNGQGGEGLARRLAAILGKDGFKRPRLTNHSDFDQAVSYVEYREGYREQATAFAALLPFRPTLRPAESSLIVDVRLMLGKDLNTADACEALGLCTTYARGTPPIQAQTAARDASLTPVSDGAAQRKRPPPDRI